MGASPTPSAAPRAMVAGVWRAVRRVRPGGSARMVWRGVMEHDVLTYASAIAFQVFFALIPLALFALGLLGMLDLREAWRADLAPDVRRAVSGDVFRITEDTVRLILGGRHVFWATAGGLLAVWKVSGAVRGVMGIFNAIYGAAERRSAPRRLAVSIALAAAATVLCIAAFAVVRFGALVVDGPPLVDVASFVVRTAAAFGLLLVLVALLVRFAPATARPWHWVTFGAVVSVSAWTVTSLGFWWYLTAVADYGSIFGNLATVFVLLEYLYLSVIAFLTGVLIDALARREVHEAEPAAAR